MRTMMKTMMIMWKSREAVATVYKDVYRIGDVLPSMMTMWESNQ
jgi:hypothetical protein